MKKRHLVLFAICSAVLIQCSNPSASGGAGDTDGTETPGTETPGTETPGTTPETPDAGTPGTETPVTETPNPDAKNCSLTDLVTSAGYWETAFASETTSYSLLEIPQTSATGMTCTATAGATGQTLKIKVNSGDLTAMTSGTAAALNPALELGDNTVTISVVSPDGTETRDYTVTARVFKVDASVVGFGNIQNPGSASGSVGGSRTFYGQVYVSGITESAGAPAGIHAQFAVGPDGTDPRTGDRWRYYNASWHVQADNNDEFEYTLTLPGATGTYKYAFRYSQDGKTWAYGDFGGQLGTLTVTN